jgi:hypothetical protein
MQVLTPGHKYLLNGKGKFSTTSQELCFVQRDKNGDLLPGTTNEEVLTVLIDRLYHQQSGKFSENTMEALAILKQAKKLLAVEQGKKVRRAKSIDKEEF